MIRDKEYIVNGRIVFNIDTLTDHQNRDIQRYALASGLSRALNLQISENELIANSRRSYISSFTVKRLDGTNRPGISFGEALAEMLALPSLVGLRADGDIRTLEVGSIEPEAAVYRIIKGKVQKVEKQIDWDA